MPTPTDVTFNLQDVLRDMEHRLSTKIENSQDTSSRANVDLQKLLSDLDTKVEGFNVRLTAAENDIKNAKRVGYAGLTGLVGFLVDFAKRHTLG